MRTIMLSCWCFGIGLTVLAQASNFPCSKESTHIHQVFKKGGWAIPGLDGSHAVSQRVSVNKSLAANIFRTQLAPRKGEVLTDLPYYILKCDQLEIKQQPFAIRNISQFDVGRKVFAYFAEGIYTNSVRPPVTYAGAVSYFLFVDTTGSGIFDLYQTDVSVPFKSGVPAWVQKLAPARH
jgi:hypothetical protein